jgi:hypothetical protein
MSLVPRRTKIREVSTLLPSPKKIGWIGPKLLTAISVLAGEKLVLFTKRYKFLSFLVGIYKIST